MDLQAPQVFFHGLLDCPYLSHTCVSCSNHREEDEYSIDVKPLLKGISLTLPT